MCGDRPCIVALEVSRRECGSPACAGIDLMGGIVALRFPRIDPAPTAIWFPRVCGDRPKLRRRFVTFPRVCGLTAHVLGSPACAGIDLGCSVDCLFGFGFPRVCGDRPFTYTLIKPRL